MILKKLFIIKCGFIHNAVLSIFIITAGLCLSNCNTYTHTGHKANILFADQEKKETLYTIKHSIAVAGITDETGGNWWNPAIGTGISEMLSTALFYTNHYIVLEYRDTDYISQEEDIYKETDDKNLTGPLPSELIIRGNIISFNPAVYNRSGRLTRQSNITLNLTIIETASLHKITKFTATGTSDDPDINDNFTGFNGCFDEWINTPECKAIKSCITRAIKTIVIKTDAWYLNKEENRLQTQGSEENMGQFITVIAERANTRKGPGTKNDIKCVVTKGERFKLVGKKGSWYKILLQSGEIAWIYKTLIK